MPDDLRALPGLSTATHTVIADDDPDAVNTARQPERVTPRDLDRPGVADAARLADLVVVCARAGVLPVVATGRVVARESWALDLAKEAQRAGHNERLNEGVYALGEAIEHADTHTHDAAEHIKRAIMKLSQSAGLQIPGGVPTGQSPTAAGG